MRTILGLTIGAALVFATGAAFGQTTPKKLSFEVASVKPSELDMMKIAAQVQAGNMPKVGAHVDGSQAKYTWVTLKDLITLAYKVKPFQITGPDWLGTERFDIVAKLPDGASKDDVPEMLQSLVEERFKLAVHRDTQEHPILALVAGKGGPKLQSSPEAAAIDESVPLKPGEQSIDGPDGPIRVMADPKTGGGTMNMGKKGTMNFKMDPATMSMHMEFSQVTMEGFADMLTQFSQMAGGGGRQVKDMTELKGNYQVSLDISMADLMAMAQSQGFGVPGAAGGAGGAAAATPGAGASDPSGNSSLFNAVAALGLKLEQRKAPVEQLIVDHAEKTPTEN
jgi:uncharacterized protein (TIGR03435 family)